MTSLLAAVASGVALLALLTGCAAHLSRPAGLPRALRLHGVLPDPAVRTASLAVPAAEGGLGLGGVAALAAGSRTGLTGVLAGAALLFGLYALYTRHALVSGAAGPCGCARTELPLSDWITTRATALALSAATAAVLVGPLQAASPAGGARTAIALLAAATLALLLWTLPAAMHDPAGPSPAPTPGHTDASRTRATAAAVPATGVTGGPPWTS